MAEKTTTKGYELLASRYHETTSKPGEPFTYKTYEKGDKIQLDAEQAKRLIDAGAVKDPKAAKDSGEPGGTPKAPGGEARGVDADADAEKGTIGDGGPDPQGTGSTDASGTGGGAGDGQGSAADNPGASTPTPPSRGRGSRSAS